MSDIEQYIRQNKDSFDDYEPSQALWSRIEKKLQQPVRPRGGLIIMNKTKWAVAALLVLAAGSFIYFYSSTPAAHTTHDIAATVTGNSDGSNLQQATTPIQLTDDTIVEAAATTPPGAEPITPIPKNRKNYEEHTIVSKEMYHYAQLIELRQKEMEAIKHEDPALYKKFSKDLELLEVSYDALKEKKAKGVNNEQLLEAMIQNLKMQSDLLNRQLEITKSIKNKHSENEKTNSL